MINRARSVLALASILTAAAVATTLPVAVLVDPAAYSAPSTQPIGARVDYSDCEKLAELSLPLGARVTIARAIMASAERPWTSPDGFRGQAKVRSSFCRIAGAVSPVEGSEVGFELWLPLSKVWNGRFYGTAVGGSMGAIQYASLPMPLSRGFAVMGHDNGHKSANTYEQNWAFDALRRQVRREKVVDFASRAQHVSTVVAKRITAAFYGRAPRWSYYVGCSQGGHHGMMEAERFPEDYDGIVAGAHGGDWSGMMASEAWAAIAVLRNDRAGALSRLMLGALNRRVLESCDGKDGLVDGQIEDPRICRFDPAEMACGRNGADPEACLKPAQVDAVRAIYQGPRTSQGRQLAPGYPAGSEPFWEWHDQTQPRSGSYYDFYRLVMQQNPEWDLLSMDWGRDIDRGRQQWSNVYDAINPDLSAFRRRGGKLILYHGWSDGLITPNLSVEAWERIERHMGPRKVRDFARLFMIPGMAHCSGGPVGATRDAHEELWLAAIQRWVEQKSPPDGTRPDNGLIGTGMIDGRSRTRPYCPFPSIARYKGSGDVNDARNFACGRLPVPASTK